MQKTNRLKVLAVMLLFLVSGWAALHAQDTLFLIDREPKLVTVYEVNDSLIIYSNTGGERKRLIERDKVYSINSVGQAPRIIYIQDTLEGNWYTAAQMADYLKGQEDARKHYGKRATGTALFGFVVGAGGAFAGLQYGPLFVLGYSTLAGIMKPAFNKRLGFDPLMKDNSHYREGFGTIAKRKALRRSALGSGVGFVAGLVTLTILYK